MYPDLLVHDCSEVYLKSRSHVDRGAVIVMFVSKLYDWASQQDKQIVGRQIVPLFFFLIFYIPDIV